MSMELESLLRPLIRRQARALVESDASPLPVTQSKIGGMPYMEQGECWPNCQACGAPLRFVCQMDVRAAGLADELGIGFFTFFYCWDCNPWDGGAETAGQWLVRAYPSVHLPRAAPISGDIPPGYSVGFDQVQSLPDWETIAEIAPEILDMASEENDDEPWEAYNDAVRSLIGESRGGTAVGGWPRWIQGYSRPDGFHLLAMIDSAGEIVWGDAGIAYLFVSELEPRRFSFAIQCT